MFFAVVEMQGQLIFTNKDATSPNIPKFEVINGRTSIYAKVGGSTSLFQSWNKVPILISSQDNINTYKLTVYKTDVAANRTYEISYSLQLVNNNYQGYIKSIYKYKDKRPTKIFEEYFDIKP